MTDSELEALLADLESHRVERKASLSDRDRIGEAICAFANDLPNTQQPGVIFVGVNDDGSPARLRITEETLLTLAAIRSDGNVLPLPVMSVEKRALADAEVAVVIVHPSDAPPVRFKGRTWVRIGPRRATATVEEERRLNEKRLGKMLPFDLHPMTVACAADLDDTLFIRVYLPSCLPADVLEENQRSYEHQLSALRFTTLGFPPVPTVLGVLVVGKNPRVLIPCAYIQFLRIDGVTLTDPIKDQKVIDGPLPDLLRMLDAVFAAHITTALDITSGNIEQRQADYPLAALQQLARNAVLHRVYEGTHAPVRITWFSDRIEIQNPGGPFGQVTRENFGRSGVTDYRNPHLAEAMKNLGYVQRFGVGIEIARNGLEKNGNPPLEYVVEDTRVLAIVRRRQM